MPRSSRQQVVAYRNGAPVRLGDVAQVIDSVENIRTANWFRGQRAIVLAIQRQPGSNTIEVVDAIKKVLPHFLAAASGVGASGDRFTTAARPIRASVADVQMTLLIAAVLVVGRHLRVPAHACRPPSFRRWRCRSP